MVYCDRYPDCCCCSSNYVALRSWWAFFALLRTKCVCSVVVIFPGGNSTEQEGQGVPTTPVIILSSWNYTYVLHSSNNKYDFSSFLLHSVLSSVVKLLFPCCRVLLFSAFVLLDNYIHDNDDVYYSLHNNSQSLVVNSKNWCDVSDYYYY